jgi:hypothetical protein
MRTRIVALIAALALGVAVPAAQPAQPASGPQIAFVAKKCGAGYTPAKIGGKKKCLRRGQFCAKAYKKQYKKYGFKCAKDGKYYRLK